MQFFYRFTNTNIGTFERICKMYSTRWSEEVFFKEGK